jgi:DNA-binding beta-propeller fold protein YncE
MKLRAWQFLSLFKPNVTLVSVFLLVGAGNIFADSHAYVFANGNGAPDAPGAPSSVIPFSISKLGFGSAYFVPTGATVFTVAPVTGEIWEATAMTNCSTTCQTSYNINILSAANGSVIATMSMNDQVNGLVFDHAGVYVYAVSGNGDLLQISVAQRTITQTLSGLGPQGLDVSSDGTRLYTTLGGRLAKLSTQPMKIVAKSAALPGQDFSFQLDGATVLVSSGTQLLYYDSATLQQTQPSVSVPPVAWLIGLSPDGTKAYLETSTYSNNPISLEEFDFATGTLLNSRTFPGLYLQVVIAPDGQHLLLPGAQIQILDANTLATVHTVTPVAAPGPLAFLGTDTILMLYGSTAVMMEVDQASAQVIDTFPAGTTFYMNSMATQGGKYILVGGDENLLTVDTTLNSVVDTYYLGVPFYPHSKIGDQVYGTPGYSPELAYSTTTGALTTLSGLSMGMCKPGQCYAFFGPTGSPPNGQTYWASFEVFSNFTGYGVGQGLAIYSTATNTLVGEVPLPQCCPSQIVFSPDSGRAYVAMNDQIFVYSAVTGQIVATFSPPALGPLAVTPDGGRLYNLTGASVLVLSALTGATVNTYALPDSPQSMAISPDGTALFLTDSNSSKLDILDTITGNVTQVPLPYPPSNVVAIPKGL